MDWLMDMEIAVYLSYPAAATEYCYPFTLSQRNAFNEAIWFNAQNWKSSSSSSSIQK